MKLLIFLFLVLNVVACSTSSTSPTGPSTGAGSESKRIEYLSSDLTEYFKQQIPDFPKTGSAAQSVDEFALRKFQSSRSNKDCIRAYSEVTVNLQTFFGKPYGPLNEKQVAALNPWFELIKHDAGYYVGQIKRQFNRPRPYVYMKGITPCLPLEKSTAYPSGHAALGMVYALVLIDLFPEQAALLKERAEVLAKDRVIGGVHHPSDVDVGKKFGQMLYNEISKSHRYKEDLEKYRAAGNSLK